ncbi:MAG: hypothetical protein AAF990_24475 [Bacteroidota bacterium]
MKNILSIFVFVVLLQSSATAQLYVGETDINQMEELHYITIRLGSPFTKSYALVDYGQPNCRQAFKRCKILDENGKIISFRTEVALFNFMREKGWDYHSSHFDEATTLVEGQITVRNRYVFEKNTANDGYYQQSEN